MVMNVQKPTDPDGLVLEAWAQGYMVGSLVVMAFITVANMRSGVLLHRLIFLELILGCFHGTFIFMHEPVYGRYLSATAVPLNVAWVLHNVIAWLKTKPFLTRRWSIFYITTIALTLPYWIVEMYANYTYFNNINNLFTYTRPYEAVFRDPWWVASVVLLFWNVKTRYEFGVLELLRVSPRFAVLAAVMALSIIFVVTDILAVTHVVQGAGLPNGINPFWKMAFVFRCLTDTVILDDFKTALDRLKDYRLRRLGSAVADPLRPLGTPQGCAAVGNGKRKQSVPSWEDETDAHDGLAKMNVEHIDLEAAR
ncbi:hypothetical protein LTR28_005900, partial [Elasticomyces elasticus]